MRGALAVFLALLLLPQMAAAQEEIRGSSFHTPRVPSTADRHLYLAPSGSRFQRDSPAREPLPAWALPPAAAGWFAPPIVVPAQSVEVNVPPPAGEAAAPAEVGPEQWVIEPVHPESPDRFYISSPPQAPAEARWLCRVEGEETRYIVSEEACTG